MNRYKMQMWKLILSGVLFFISDIANAQHDSLPATGSKFIHRLGVEARTEYVFPSNIFLQGDNRQNKAINNSFSGHLKYSFGYRPDSYAGNIYKGVYQGIGIGYYDFGNSEELGNPLAFYVFQGGTIAQFHPRLSLNYEWNFGLSTGWKPYDEFTNPKNVSIGSKMNAYLNVNFYLNWMLTRKWDLSLGVTGAHFSNGNTSVPNGGLNSAGVRLGLVYNFNRENDSFVSSGSRFAVPIFPRHISYDLVMFGSWRRKGVFDGSYQVASPESYAVMGFNFAPMYNINYKFRAGVSLDGIYDASANIQKDNSGSSPSGFTHPSFSRQASLGLSARAEFVMPYFSINLGMGTNILHGGGELKLFYQVLALKMQLTRSSFLHIGYTLQDFHTPSYLMLGIGYRFNNKYPRFQR